VQRPGAMALLTGCISKGIPVAIVSAGLSFVIEEFVRKHDASGKFFSKVLYTVTFYSKCSRALTFEIFFSGSLLSSPLFSIHSNVLEFDAKGTLIGRVLGVCSIKK